MITQLYQIGGVLSQQNPLELHLRAYRSNTFVAEIRVTDTGIGRVVDFTEWDNARIDVKRNVADVTPVLSFSTANNPSDFVLAADKITLTKSATEMANVTGGTYQYDLILEKNTGEKFTILRGQFKVTDNITT